MESRIYVGTYSKYNSGSLNGAWLDMEDYTDRDEFYQACAELHKDEHDPEYMFQDWEGIPAGMVGESWVDEKAWDWLGLDKYEKELLQIYRENHDSEATLEQAQDAFHGCYDSEAGFCEEMANDTGAVSSENASWIVIDWQATWDCNLRHDFFSVYEDGAYWIFSRYC